MTTVEKLSGKVRDREEHEIAEYHCDGADNVEIYLCDDHDELLGVTVYHTNNGDSGFISTRAWGIGTLTQDISWTIEGPVGGLRFVAQPVPAAQPVSVAQSVPTAPTEGSLDVTVMTHD